jgi:hypothetical protein
MAQFLVFTKNGWKGPFPEAALISKYRQGGIPDGTRIQDTVSGGEMAIEDLVADATVILKKSEYGTKPPTGNVAKLSPAEARAATEKLPANRPRASTVATAPTVKLPEKPAAKPAPRKEAPAKPQPEPEPEPATSPSGRKLPVKPPLAKFPPRGGTRANLPAAPEKKSRGLNWLFVFGCLGLLAGFGGPFLSFPQGSAGGTELMLFGFDLPYRLTAGAHELAWQPPAPLGWAFNALYLMYLIPLVVLIALVDEFISKGSGRNRWYVRLLVALIAPGCALAIAALFFSAQAAGIAGDAAVPQVMREATTFQGFLQATFDSGREFFSLGPLLMAGGSALCLLSVVLSPRRKKPEPVIEPRKSESAS